MQISLWLYFGILIYVLEMRENGNKIKGVYLQNYSYRSC